MSILQVVVVLLLHPLLWFTSVEILFVDIYCVHKILIINLNVNSVMLHVRCEIIIEGTAEFFEHDYGAVAEVHVYSWF